MEMTRDEALKVWLPVILMGVETMPKCKEALDMAIKALEQEPKIKVLERDEAMRKLGAVDIYQARAWITLLDDLEYLKLKICEVEE